MNAKFYVPVLAAGLVLAGASYASAEQQQNTATTYGAGAAQAGRSGAVAGGVVGGEVKYSTPAAQNSQKGRKNRDDRARNNGGSSTSPVAVPNSATTYGAGAIYTDRNRASGAATTGATATGTGTQAATSEVDVYGVTDKQGSEAGAYGNSTAVSVERQQRPRSPR